MAKSLTALHFGSIPLQTNGHNPSLCVFENRLYCAFTDNNGNLKYSRLSAGNTAWGVIRTFSTTLESSAGPSLVVYNNILYCFFNSGGNLYYVTSSDGINWYPVQQVNNVGITASPAAVSYNGILYCIHQGNSNSGWTCLSSFNGNFWEADTLIPDSNNAYGLSDSPAVCVWGNTIFCVRQGRGDSGWTWAGTSFYTGYGATWSADSLIPDTNNAYGISGNFIPGASNAYGISGSPALALSPNGNLVCVRQGRQNCGELWYGKYNGSGWNADEQINLDSSVSNASTPSIATFNGQLYCVYLRNNDTLVYGTFS